MTGKARIVEELNEFLSKRPQIREKSEVVYLMVELRKLLDREREHNGSDLYTLVRFYADWTLHTKKNRITPAIKKIMLDINNSIDTYPKDGNIDFLLLPKFRRKLTQLLQKYDLPNEFCKNDDGWIDFMVALTQVLADQPIVNPTENIAEFRYVNVKREGVMATINFKGARPGASITLGFGL